MSAGHPAPELSKRRRSRIWLWLLGGLFVLLVVGVVGGKAWVAAYLRSDKFREFVDRKVGRSLNAKAELAPLGVSGQRFYSDSLQAHGYEGTWFSELRLDQLRVDLSTRRFSERVWQVDQAIVERAEVQIEGPKLSKPPEGPKDDRDAGVKTPGFLRELLPNRVEISEAAIKDATIRWKDGGLESTSLSARPQDGTWLLQAVGGSVAHSTLPPVELSRARIRYKEPSLFIQEAELRQKDGGTVNVSGEVRLKDSVDLIAKLEGVSVTPYLDGDWRARLRGKVSGDVRVQSPLGGDAQPVVSGSVYMKEGTLEALPVLDTIANFTRTAQFRKLNVTTATADFRHSGERLEVSRFVVESTGLIKMEGSLTVVSGQIEGIVQLGVTPSSLQWLPGSQERVFTASRDGYLWSPVRISGPVAKPKEDLSPRLAAAAKSALFDTAEGAVRDATGPAKDLLKGAQDAAKGALDSLLGR